MLDCRTFDTVVDRVSSFFFLCYLFSSMNDCRLRDTSKLFALIDSSPAGFSLADPTRARSIERHFDGRQTKIELESARRSCSSLADHENASFVAFFSDSSTTILFHSIQKFVYLFLFLNQNISWQKSNRILQSLICGMQFCWINRLRM